MARGNQSRQRELPTITVRLPPHLIGQLYTIAGEGGPAVPTIVREALERWLAEYREGSTAGAVSAPALPERRA